MSSTHPKKYSVHHSVTRPINLGVIEQTEILQL